jgi:hypothetical protein
LTVTNMQGNVVSKKVFLYNEDKYWWERLLNDV